jgi:glycosyltransferase involved in cell wall biosynthesis
MLSLVVPVYNEGANADRLLDEIARKVKSPHELLVVYDFEEDDTLPVIRARATELPHLRLLKNPSRGALAAIKHGLSQAGGSAAVVVMADLADDLVVVDEMFTLSQAGYDVVCGSRYMPGGRQIGGPPFKTFLSRLAGLSAHWLSGVPTHDITNSFKMYRTAMLRATPIESTGGFELGLELTTKAYLSGRRITEVPSVWTDRTAGESRFRLVAWLPCYLKWYTKLMLGGLPQRLGRRPSRVADEPAG